MILVTLTRWLQFVLAPFAPTAPLPPRRVLVVQTAKIGDAVSTTPLLRELRAALPGTHIAVLAAPLTAPLWRHNPHVDAVIELKGGSPRGIAGRWRLAQRLRAQGFDAVLCCNGGALWPVVLAWAGIPERIGIAPNFGGRTTRAAARLWSWAADHHQGRLVIETWLDMLGALGITASNLDKEAFSAPGAAVKAAALLPAGTRHVGIAVSAGNKLKELGIDKLADVVAGVLAGAADVRVVLLGTAGDAAAAQQLTARLAAADAARIVDACGAVALDELPALVARLDLFIGVDSGLTYIADALGVPLVSVAGPADMEDARPLGPRSVIIRRDLPCAPCSHYFRAPYTCRIGTRACIVEVTADEIVAAAIRQIDGSAA